MKEYIFKW